MVDLIGGGLDNDNAMIPVEFSKSWPAIFSYIETGDVRLIPSEMTVFMIAWLDPDSDKFSSWGYYMSTSEPAPTPGLVAFVAAEVTVPVKAKSEQGLFEAAKYAVYLIAETVFKDPAPHYQKFRNKLESDIIKDKHKIALPVDYVSEAEYRAQIARSRKAS